MKKFKKKGISARTLLLNGDNNLKDPTANYRWVDDAHFSDVPFYVYGNKCAIIVWKPEMQIILIENKAVADAYKKQFEGLWKGAKTPTKAKK